MDWVVDMIKEYGKEIFKVIIFCDILYLIVSVWNYFMMFLGENVFYLKIFKKCEYCVFGIFYFFLLKEYK